MLFVADVAMEKTPGALLGQVWVEGYHDSRWLPESSAVCLNDISACALQSLHAIACGGNRLCYPAIQRYHTAEAYDDQLH